MEHDSVVLSIGQVVVLIPERKRLKIFEQDGIDEGAYCPPKFVEIIGDRDLKKVRDMLNKAYPPESEGTE